MGWIVPLGVALAACSQNPSDNQLLQVVEKRPVRIEIQAEGELHAARATQLVVPGQMGSRTIVVLAPDASHVGKGDLVARFTADDSRMQVGMDMAELQRILLSRVAKAAELDDSLGRLQVDLSDVTGLLRIAQRYASADELALARNTILDAVQDEGFLDARQKVLRNRSDLSERRGAAELAVIDAQRAATEKRLGERRGDLEGLEIRAPYEGIVVLQQGWTQEKPRLGASIWAGSPLASIPDLDALEVELSVPQIEAQGAREGQSVELAPLGVPEQRVISKLSWVATAPVTRVGNSPVRYVSMKAPVPKDFVRRYGWMPGRRFVGHIILLQSQDAITVPNFAIRSIGGASEVDVRRDGRIERRVVRLGVRGPARSEVIEGLKPGDQIVIELQNASPAVARKTAVRVAGRP